MRRLLPALLAAALLAPSALAYAHDPLDDVSGEEDLSPKPDEQKPESHRKAKEEAEFKNELQERDDTSFAVDQEKEEFLRDKAETKDVLEAQRRRNQLSGTAGRYHAPPPAPKPEPSATQDDASQPQATPGPAASERGDVDPTDASNVKGEESNAPQKKVEGKKHKKKH